MTDEWEETPIFSLAFFFYTSDVCCPRFGASRLVKNDRASSSSEAARSLHTSPHPGRVGRSRVVAPPPSRRARGIKPRGPRPLSPRGLPGLGRSASRGTLTVSYALRAIAGPDPGVGSRSPLRGSPRRADRASLSRAPIPTRRARGAACERRGRGRRERPARASPPHRRARRRRVRRAPHAAPFVVSTTDARGASSTSRVASASAATTASASAPDPAPGVDYPRVTATAREVSARTIDFLRWLDGVRAECVARGVSEATVRACFDGMEPTRRSPSPRSRPRRRTTRLRPRRSTSRRVRWRSTSSGS